MSTEAVFFFTKLERRAPAKQDHRAMMTGTALRMTFVGGNSKTRVTGKEELAGKANYFIGNDPTKWRADVPTYAKVVYEDVYPGIDLAYYGNQGQLEYDFIVQPHANPKSIVLGFEGADNLEIDAQGDLALQTVTGAIRQRKPRIYQDDNGVRREISGGYVLKGAHQVGFQLAAYDATRPLVIDPVLFYSTYLGGSGDDTSEAITVDGAGNAYVAGFTASANFPTTLGAFQTALSGVSFDAFVTKLNPTGSGLVYSTYLGGSGGDFGFAVALDSSGNAYVSGFTDSTNFPTTPGAFQTTFAGGGGLDAFITKLNPSGSALVYSTYLGGAGGSDEGTALAIDATGNAYIGGVTESTSFPTTLGAFQTSYAGGVFDAFVTKLNSSGTALVYSTYLGGNGQDEGHGITIDATGNAYLTSLTNSTNFPTTIGAFQTANAGGFDASVTKVNPIGSALVYSTYLGGPGNDVGLGVTLDTLANAYVVGAAGSGFPTTTGAFQTTHGGGQDAFVAKLNGIGSMLVYSTFLGGSGDDSGQAIALDATGNAYVTGSTLSSDFPTVSAFQPANGGYFDAFVTKVNPLASALVYSSYLGGGGLEQGLGIALDALPNPNAHVSGVTASTNFPTTTGAFDTTYNGGGSDAFVTKIADVSSGCSVTSEGEQGECNQVDGGGMNDEQGGNGTFSLILRQSLITQRISGELQYVNRAAGIRLQSVALNSMVITEDTATLAGTCINNNAPCIFSVAVMGNSPGGLADTFAISISNGPIIGGRLSSGNIRIVRRR